MRAGCLVHSASVMVGSKCSAVGRPRRGSNPARRNVGKKNVFGAPRSSPHRDLSPTARCVENTRIPQLTPDPPGSWILAPDSSFCCCCCLRTPQYSITPLLLELFSYHDRH